jgi:2-methylcitrate dehydratase PrpD
LCVGRAVHRQRQARRASREGDGRAAGAKVIGTGDKLSASAAVFANGELINALDFDVLTIPPGHVAPYVLPAILAMAEREGRSGKRLISAVAVAHEVSARFGLAMGYYRDVTPGQKISLPAVSGYSSTIFGGTLATAALRELDSERTASAMGLAGHIAPAQSQSKWGRTVPGADNKYLMSGWIGQAELLAVLLAEHGYRGDVEVLEGEFGFWRYMGSSKWNPEPLVDGLGERWHFPAVTIYKPYPHCRNTHTVLDCLRHLIEQHGLRPEEIERVTTYSDSHTASLPLYSTKRIESPADAQMSTAYAVSMAVHGVKEGSEWHEDATLAEPRFLAFMEKVTAEPHPEFERALIQDPQSRIGKVEIAARGKVFSEERRYRKGSPATPETRMSDAELVAKFAHNAHKVLTAETIDRVTQTILKLDEVEDVCDLTRMW